MEANQVNALIASLRMQRNTALDGLATVQSELTVAKDVIAAQQKQIGALADELNKVATE